MAGPGGNHAALTAIHGAGVVHRDFKPANVLLGPDGPRVVDFGIARLTDAATITSGVIGTPSYMAPEQLAGEHPTSAVDIFAWAVTLIYAATGRTAFGADAVPTVMYRILNAEPDLEGVPPSLLPLLRQCLAKDPLRRPAARDVLLAIVDPSARQSLATSRDQEATVGGAASGPARTSPVPLSASTVSASTVSASTGPAEAVSDLPAPGIQPVPGLPGLRRRGLLLAALGTVALAAFTVTGVLLILKPSSSPSAAVGQSSSTPAAVQTVTATAPSGAAVATAPSAAAVATEPSASAVAGGPEVPASFAGKWSGTAMQSAIADPQVQLPNSITLTLAAGGRTAHEQDQDCVNTLTIVKVTATMLTFGEPEVPGTCVGGTVTLKLNGKDLAYRWTDGVEQNVGKLSRG